MVYGPRGEVLAAAPSGWQEHVVLTEIPTQSEMAPGLGRLDLAAYSAWTADQPGTTYWHTDNVGPLSFAHDMRAMHERATDASETDADFLRRTRAEQPWSRASSERSAARGSTQRVLGDPATT